MEGIMKVNMYIEVTQLAAQYEPVKIGIGIEDDFEPREGESKADTFRRASASLYDLTSDEVSSKITQAISELRA
jgi:hypothetical protein